MLKLCLCDYSDVQILVKRTMTISGTGDNAGQTDEINKEEKFKNYTPFSSCISEINNTQIDNAKDRDFVMPMYNSIEYSDDYSKTYGSLWQYYKDEPSVNLADCE